MMQGELRNRARVVESLPAGLPPVAGNGSRLSQVFLNLLVNAAHAIPEGRAEANVDRRQRARRPTVRSSSRSPTPAVGSRRT